MTTPRTPSTRTGAWGRTQALDATLLALLALVLRIPAFLADAALHFDDGPEIGRAHV